MNEEVELHEVRVTCPKSSGFKVAGFIPDLPQSKTNVLDSIS